MLSMARILITGMSGTGKSTAIIALRARGFAAVDVDEPGWSTYADIHGEQEWVWDENRLRTWLNTSTDRHLFVAGCCCIQRNLYPLFEIKVLLTAPLAVILERVQTRSTNPYGRTVADRAAITRNVATIEPRLRQHVDSILDSTELNPAQITDALLALAAAYST